MCFNFSVYILYHHTRNKMAGRRETLPFKLVGMTEDELYDIINEIGNDCAPIPLDIGSDNDSDAEVEEEEIIQGIHENSNNFVDGKDNEFVLSASDNDESEWEAEDTVPLASLAHIYIYT